MSDSFVDDTGFVDDLAPPQRPRQRPTYSLGGLSRQFVGGIAQAPLDLTLGIPGALGSETAANAYRTSVDAVNQFMGVEDPRWREDLPGFVARELGSAVVGLPAGALGAGYRLFSNAPAVVQAGLRAVEAITPLTLPLTRRNIVLNAAVGGAAGAGMQEFMGVEEQAREDELRRQAANAAQQRYSGQIPQGTDQFVDDTATEFVDDTPRTWQGRVAPYIAPAIIAAGGGAVGITAYRGIRNQQAGQAAQDRLDVVAPGTEEASLAYQPTGMERFAQNFVNEGTVLYNAIGDAQRRGAITADEAAEARADISRIYTEAPRYDTISEALETGIAPLTGQRFASSQEIEVPYSRLDPTDRAELDALRAAANELDNRIRNARENNMAVYNGQSVPARVNLWDKDDAQLRQIVQQGMANPRLTEMIAALTKASDDQLDYMVGTNIKTAAEVRAMKAEHPHYMFTLIEGNTPASARTYTDQSGLLRSHSPIVAHNESWRRLMSAAMVNDAVNRLAKIATDYNNVLGPMERRALGNVIPRGASARNGFAEIPFTDRNTGKQLKLEVSKDVADLLGSTPRATWGILSGFSNAYRSFTTGPLGALLGSLMAPVSAAMASMAVSIARPRGATAGVFDTALKRISGGRLGMPGDISFLFQTAGQALADLTSQSSQWLFQALQRSRMNNGPLTSVLGQQGSLDLMRWAQRYYEGSNLAAMRRSGATGTGLGYDPAAQYKLSPGLQLRTPEGRQSALMPNSIQDAGGLVNYVTQAGGKITPVQAQRAWDMWKQALDIISGSATSAYFRLNRGRGGASDAVIAAEARGLAGDPSAMGANKLWQGFLSTTPYSNITVQGIAAQAKKANDDFSHFITSLLIATSTIPLIQIMSAMFADKVELENGRPNKYVAHMLMQNSNHALADMRVYIPGVAPEFGFRITPDHTVMPLMALTQRLLIQILGADKPEFWSPEMAPLRDHFVEFMSDRTSNAMWSAIGTSYGQIAPNPLVAGVLEAATGANLQNALNIVNPNITVPRDVGAPGYEDRQGSNDPIPRTVRTLVTNFTGAAADPILSGLTTAFIASLAEGGEPLAAAVDDLSIRAAGNIRQAAPLLQQQRRLVQRDAVGDILVNQEKKLEEIARGLPDITRPDTVGAGGSTRLATGVGRQPPPADIIPYLLEAGRMYSRGALPDLREQRAALQQDILSIENDPKRANNPQERLRLINERVEEIRQLNQMMYTQIQAMETNMSLRSGRRINLERLDPQRGLDQFPSLR